VFETNSIRKKAMYRDAAARRTLRFFVKIALFRIATIEPATDRTKEKFEIYGLRTRPSGTRHDRKSAASKDAGRHHSP
jgi:hypothetical protein